MVENSESCLDIGMIFPGACFSVDPDIINFEAKLSSELLVAKLLADDDLLLGIDISDLLDPPRLSFSEFLL